MMSLKDRVTQVFESIQYQSEVYSSQLDELNDSKFKRVLRQYLIRKLKNSSNTLLKSKSAEELETALGLIESDYQQLFENISLQISKLRNGEDVSDYVYQLKEESHDLFFIAQEKLKRLF